MSKSVVGHNQEKTKKKQKKLYSGNWTLNRKKNYKSRCYDLCSSGCWDNLRTPQDRTIKNVTQYDQGKSINATKIDSDASSSTHLGKNQRIEIKDDT